MTRILCLRFPPPRRSSGYVPRGAEPDVSGDASLRLRLAADCEEFSPLIGWVEGTPGCGMPEPCLCLEIDRTAHGFGGEAGLLAAVARWARRRNLPLTGAAADTLGAAWAWTYFGTPPSSAAQAREKPVLRAVSGDVRAALAPLSPAALRLPSQVVALLRELGLDTIGPLLTIPRAALAERFGAAFILRIDQALGAVPELFASFRAPPIAEAEMDWEGPLTSLAPLATAWEHLLPRLTSESARRGHGIARLALELRGEQRRLRRYIIGLLRPTLDEPHLLGLLKLRLETLQPAVLRTLGPIVGTRLLVLEEVPRAEQQQVLFADLAPPCETAAWTTLVERLSGRLGGEAVLRAHLVDEHLPERAWRYEPAVNPRRTARLTARPPARPARTTKRPADEEPSLPPRPTLLLAKPRPIRVVASPPEYRPRQFRDGTAEQQVRRCWGPQRIETGWWRGPGARRDYYRVEATSGARYWLFRRLCDGVWFLHGWFD